MSYILDALQRADAERERGHVPGLNSQRVPPASRKPVQTRRWRPWHVVLAVGMGLCVVLALWWWQPPSVESMPTAPIAPPAPTSQEPAPTVINPPPVAARPEPVLPILAPPRAEPVAPPKNATATAKAPAPAANASTAQGPAEPASTAPVRSFAELSPEARAQLPAVNVSGATYSKDAAVRMLIVNGKVVQEGQEIAPGLRLETIGQRSAVLNHQGLRYSIGY
ncbi:MAG: general secretion pathway protein GspB [Hydrogenophaga sp.]|uniref:general secretion pathway protein GspB n=1 Tax=Hydrogenophaga sp. TaxID=1904254 RepID=UPI003D11B875